MLMWVRVNLCSCARILDTSLTIETINTYTLHYIMYILTSYVTLYRVHCTVYSVFCIVYSVLCAVYSVYCTEYSVYYTVYIVHKFTLHLPIIGMKPL